MLERAFTASHVVPALNLAFSDQCEIIKHCDTFTKGVPDLTVTGGEATFWIEAKVLRKGDKDLAEEIVARKQQLQHRCLTRLYRFGRHRAVYLVRDERDMTIYWCDPTNLTVRNAVTNIRSDPKAGTLTCVYHMIRIKIR